MVFHRSGRKEGLSLSSFIGRRKLKKGKACVVKLFVLFIRVLLSFVSPVFKFLFLRYLHSMRRRTPLSVVSASDNATTFAFSPDQRQPRIGGGGLRRAEGSNNSSLRHEASRLRKGRTQCRGESFRRCSAYLVIIVITISVFSFVYYMVLQ